MINYELLSKALAYYESIGYQRIEVPWMVTEAVDLITKPADIEPLSIPSKNKNLIASGEQGFLYLMVKGYLPKGKYVTLTPCFRNDPFDLTHSKNFMKIELINTQHTTSVDLENMINDAKSFFIELFDSKNNINTTIDPGNDIWDINYLDTELGSYGIRKHQHLSWVFGTGLAEPRTSRLLKTAGLL